MRFLDGSGKARVASEIERTLSNTRATRAFAVYRVDASSLARTQGALLGAIANRLDVRLPREVWARLAAIEKRGLEFAARKAVPVIFVTNAERLNADGLDDVKAVWDLVLPSGSSFLFRVVLFAEPRLVTRLGTSRFRALRSRISPWCRLEPPG